MTIKPVIRIVSSAVFFLLFSTISLAEQGSVSQCQSIKNNIQRYTDLRREGGSSSQMTNWHNQRNKYKKQFSKYNCRLVSDKLK